ncbi:MAG: EAL domain-containing protein [Motiliproteus sp.]|nr:EAL domain-containing protein [Motiliproteus sp.]
MTDHSTVTASELSDNTHNADSSLRRSISFALLAMIVLGLLASASVAVFVGWKQAQLAEEQSRQRTIEKDLNISLEKFRRLVLETHFTTLELLYDTQVDNSSPTNQSLLLLQQESKAIKKRYSINDLGIAFGSIGNRSKEISKFWDQAIVWKRGFSHVEQDVNNQFSIDRVRDLLAFFNEDLDILEGRLKLHLTILMRKWRLERDHQDLYLANRIAELETGPWRRSLHQLRIDSHTLALDLEAVTEVKDITTLRHFRFNKIVPTLENIERILNQLKKSEAPLQQVRLPNIAPIAAAITGPDSGLPNSVERYNLFELMTNYILGIEKQQQMDAQLHAHLDQSMLTIAFMDEMVNNYLHNQQAANEQLIIETIKQGGVVLLGLLMAFLVLGRMISAQVKRQFNQLALFKRRSELILNSVGEGIIGLDRDGHHRFVNPSAALMLKRDSNNLTGIDCQDIWTNPEDYLGIEKILNGELEQIKNQESSLIDSNGHEFPIEYSISPIVKEQNVEGAVISFMDITASKHTQAELENSERQFRVLSERSLVGVYIIQDGHFVYVNPRFADIFGYPREDIEYHLGPMDLTHPEDRETVTRNITTRLKGDKAALQYAFRGMTKEGEEVHVEVFGSRTHHNGGPAIMGTLLDITERSRSEAKIQHQAYYDQLTGLPNRALFLDRLNHSLVSAKRNNSKMAVLFLDLDRFKHINDSLGHPVGDALLSSVAGRLNNSVRENDTVARLGGDEFTIILEDLSNDHEPANVAKKVLKQLTQPFQLSGHDLFISASIGICIYPQDGMDADALVRNADAAMYQAKKQGRATYAFYASKFTASSTDWLELETELRKAVNDGHLSLAFQPQVDLQNNSMIGAEALVRWNHPEKGTISPARFIPLAEETNLILDIGDWVLLESCRQMQRWQQQGLPINNLAVNISPVQLERGDLYLSVSQVLEETGLDPHLLELEITENTLMQNPDQSIAILQRLNDLGVSLSIDDFGTGYSSLNQLKNLPIQKLKIDQSFIFDVTKDPQNAAITQAIINLGKLLDLEVIAEGVETAEHRDFVINNGCDIAQGYFYAKPLSAEDCAQLFLRRSLRVIDNA